MLAAVDFVEAVLEPLANMLGASVSTSIKPDIAKIGEREQEGGEGGRFYGSCLEGITVLLKLRMRRQQ